MNKQEVIKTIYGHLSETEDECSKGTFDQGYDQGCEFCIALIEQLDEPKKVIVPQVVADWIKYAKQQGYGFMQSYDPKKMFYPINDGLDKWIDDNEETFAHAWLVGYEVKKEPTIHELKILPEYFEAVVLGNKRFEIRKNDRNYKKGDILRLNEYQDGQYTGDVHVAEITYITDYAQQDGYVVLGIK
ncbi:DUF3850 domain-containing protein [Enterococcus faecalis]|uniref:DUF3850 domain-containing protein n=1 Tax=Enterococcus faecalis TaxID=1351 RepID=UPI0035E2D368